MAWEMLNFNDMLPFRFTESKVDRLIARTYLKRNSMFSGILFTPEFSGRDLIDEDALSKNRDLFE